MIFQSVARIHEFYIRIKIGAVVMIRFIIKHKTLGFRKGRGSFSIPIGAKKTEINKTSSFKEWNKRFAKITEK